jgi:hypothetical protein
MSYMTYWQSGRLARREAKLEKVGNKPNGDRIYPQHLNAIAIAELQNTLNLLNPMSDKKFRSKLRYSQVVLDLHLFIQFRQEND